MEKLMKPAEYAKELGISRQAVYAKIKRGILIAKNVDGKLYIIIDSTIQPKQTSVKEEINIKTSTLIEPKVVLPDYGSLLLAKDETISVLKGTVKDLKKSNKQISTTLRGEIDLLKEAFHEMRNLYAIQLEYQKPQEEAIDVLSEDYGNESKEDNWISLKKFFKKMGITSSKTKNKLKDKLKVACKAGEQYVKKVDGKLKINIDKISNVDY